MEIWNPRHRQHVDCKDPSTIIHSQVGIPGGETMGTRRPLVFVLLLLPLMICVSGCTDNSRNVDRKIIMNTDLDGLKRLIHVPANVKSCEWQTGKRAPHGGDWWVAAVLEVEIEKIPDFLQGTGTKGVFETPPGLELMSSFAALKSIPGAQPMESNGIRLITETYGVAPYANSPLLNGNAIRLSANQVLVVLWTN